jgi:aminomethyltransferase
VTDAAPAVPLRSSPLAAFHREHGAHLVPFAGWEMPLYYAGILEEHRAVRESVGLFDVSHMGILTVSGAHAAELLSRRTTIDVGREPALACKYGFWLGADGRILDDLIVTRLPDAPPAPPTFLVVPNASKADRIEELLQQHRKPGTEVVRHNGAVAILAVQGPRSRERLQKLFGIDLAGLKFYTARPLDRALGPGSAGPLGNGVVSRTGYTGELGFEMFLPAPAAVGAAETLVQDGVAPCGLGARDTLRLEKGYLLSGSDFSGDVTPLEASQERFVDFDHPFVGRETLLKEREQGPPVRLVGIATHAPQAIPRHGTPVWAEGKAIAHATSGGISPTLGYGIALAYLPPTHAQPGTPVEFEIRGRRVPAEVVPLPFLSARAPPLAAPQKA